MLVISRKENEQLLIDGRIRITVIRLSNGSVRLGIDAPRECSVVRSELLDVSNVASASQATQRAAVAK